MLPFPTGWAGCLQIWLPSTGARSRAAAGTAVPSARTPCPQHQGSRFLLFPGAVADRTGCVLCPVPHGAVAHKADGVEGGGVCGHPHVLSAPQFLLPHSRGSSHGQSRIIRSAYPQEYYSRMMPESFRLWQQLEVETGTTLYR